jgi:hypothetical protein
MQKTLEFKQDEYLLQLSNKLEYYSREMEYLLELEAGSIRISLDEIHGQGFFKSMKVLRELEQTIEWAREDKKNAQVLKKIVSTYTHSTVHQ